MTPGIDFIFTMTTGRPTAGRQAPEPPPAGPTEGPTPLRVPRGGLRHRNALISRRRYLKSGVYSYMKEATGGNQKRARFLALCQALRPDLLRFAFWLSRDRALAEDVVQETMLRSWKAQDSLLDEGAA